MRNISKQKETRWVIKYSRIRLFVILIVSLLSFSSHTFAQRFSSEYWHEGTAILLDGTKYTGKIKYNFQQDIIQVQAAGVSTLYTAQNFLYFEIQDEFLNRPRRFYSLPYNPVNGYETPRMFEVYVEGNLNLLAREEIEISSKNYGYGVYRIPNQNDLVMSYYILKEGSTIRPFDGKKAELLSYMGAAKPRVEKHMKENRLNVKNKNELRRIISFYNSLFVNN